MALRWVFSISTIFIIFGITWNFVDDFLVFDNHEKIAESLLNKIDDGQNNIGDKYQIIKNSIANYQKRMENISQELINIESKFDKNRNIVRIQDTLYASIIDINEVNINTIREKLVEKINENKELAIDMGKVISRANELRTSLKEKNGDLENMINPYLA